MSAADYQKRCPFWCKVDLSGTLAVFACGAVRASGFELAEAAGADDQGKTATPDATSIPLTAEQDIYAMFLNQHGYDLNPENDLEGTETLDEQPLNQAAPPKTQSRARRIQPENFVMELPHPKVKLPMSSQEPEPRNDSSSTESDLSSVPTDFE
ncbi:hypothetical protein L228DRAFT_244779 [Xylona heveae TC161]|uniref:Uncharacterized protein n=1 Tax=Xylona heveae (strain CBS 132557 / TC161) TaxID=1328760 RepID=A0A165J7D8_XYLHT|nr:hypothetical protein L228DRAFT_244779 [Xylona heveae TC161]KZF25842.1 hypothetical protein L228DRAFT_244779 [Xylona heveae TC161]